MNVLTFTSSEQNEKFYGIMGPFFANKTFFKIFGEPLHNEQNSTWFIAFNEEEKVIGFCTAFKKKTHTFLNQFFVLDECKSKGVGTALFNTRLAYLKGCGEIRSMVKDERSIHLYRKNEFTIYGKRGNYNLVKKHI